MTARQPELLAVGTKVTAVFGGYTAYGVVDDYEHHHPHQFTFPVMFGRRLRIMVASEVTVLPDDQQPDDRQPPRHTGYYEHHVCLSCEPRIVGVTHDKR